MLCVLRYMPGVVDIARRPMVPDDFMIYAFAFLFIITLRFISWHTLDVSSCLYTDRDLLEETDEVPVIDLL